MERLKETIPTSILKLDNLGIQQKNAFTSLKVQEGLFLQQPSTDRSFVTFSERLRKEDKPNIFHFSLTKIMDKVYDCTTEINGEDSEEDNYSASVNAIIQRKASSKKSKKYLNRRTSSPFSSDNVPGIEISRRTSVFTTTSGDTAITMDDSFTQELTKEKIFENIKLHKEVLNNVKMQPWNMGKKIKLVMQAKSYVKKHEGELQDRFTKTHSIKNILARWNIYFVKNLHHYKREIANISNWMIPWERRIKEIESHFGSVVASYFIFLRWLFWVNFVTAQVLIAFIVIPEIITTTTRSNTDRKVILPEDKYNSTNLLTLWDFDGALKYTPLFYGWYTNQDNGFGYRLPLAFFMTQLLVYVYSFVATLRKMAENSRLSKLSEKGDECIFSWKLFTGWDYMIGNAETASNRVMSIVLSFKEALLEEAERKRRERNWKIIWIRVFVNITILCLFALSAAAVVVIVQRSTEPEANSTLWRRNETAVVMSLISFIFPMILELLGFMERYHPRKQLRIQLGRIMLLNLLNIFSLVFAQFDKINGMTIELLQFKKNSSLAFFEKTITNTTILPTLELKTNINDCKHTCYTSSLQNDMNIANFIAIIVTSIPMITLPFFINNIMQSLPSNDVINISDFTNLNEMFPFNFSSNSEFFNLKMSAELQKYCNKTLNENLGFIKNNSQDIGLQDYLTYILEDVYLSNTSVPNESDFIHNTFINCNLNSSENVDIEYLKSTVLPTFARTTRDVEDVFEKQITRFFNNTFNIAYLFKLSFPDRILEICKNRCVDKVLNKKNFENYSFVGTFTSTSSSISSTSNWNYQNLTKLRSLCWETMFGQEIVKLTVMDFIFTVVGTLFMDFIRGVFVRIMNKCWCWDLEKKFPEYGEFKVAENILHLVNNQGMVWMGMFFSPGIVLINVMKLMFLMYIRSWIVLTCNVPHSVIFRASRSNNFYFALLLTMLFLCVLPVGYAIVWVDPSWHCGPFSEHQRIFHILTKTVQLLIPSKLQKLLDYIVSPGIVIPLLILLTLIIYYLISLTNSLREANTDLKIQLRQERTEERRKMFQVANRRRRGGSENLEDLDNAPFNKWKKLLGNIPAVKSADKTSKEVISQNKVLKQELHKTKDIGLL